MSSESVVLPGLNGEFIALVPDELILYSSQMVPLNKLHIALSKCDLWNIYVSPGRKALLVKCGPDRHRLEETYQWIDTENLRVISEWTDSGKDIPYIQAISDHKMVTAKAIRAMDGAWRGIYRPSYLHGWTQIEFLNDDTLFRYDTTGNSPHFFSLIHTDGKVLWKQDIHASEQFSDGSIHQSRGARPAVDGNRFALPFYKRHGGSALLDIPGHYLLKQLMVYDLPSRRWIFRLDGKKQGIKTLSGLALSPDGSLIGLITQDGVLEVYRLPKPGDLPESSQ